MASPDEFEPLMKMNRIAPPSVLNGPLPVKFREVCRNSHFDMNANSRKKQFNGPDNTWIGSEREDEELKPVGLSTQHIFFKDPLCPPELLLLEDNKNDSNSTIPSKLGRNMRASNPQTSSRRHVGIQDLMNERKKLLHQQKEQQGILSKQEHSEQMAAALVNDMLQNGFHITPPEETPSVSYPQTIFQHNGSKSSSGSDENSKSSVNPTEDEGRLVLALHKEMKRVTGKDITVEEVK